MRIRKIYRQIARKNGVTIKEVRSEMQKAILWAYQNPPKSAKRRRYNRGLPEMCTMQR